MSVENAESVKNRASNSALEKPPEKPYNARVISGEVG